MELVMIYVDGALHAMVGELNARGLSESTKLIVSANHGQSPIDIVEPIHGTIYTGS
jgi:predicted AlkP superfamily pyrophosphatase or phosphodiesterase